MHQPSRYAHGRGKYDADRSRRALAPVNSHVEAQEKKEPVTTHLVARIRRVLQGYYNHDRDGEKMRKYSTIGGGLLSTILNAIEAFGSKELSVKARMEQAGFSSNELVELLSTLAATPHPTETFKALMMQLAMPELLNNVFPKLHNRMSETLGITLDDDETYTVMVTTVEQPAVLPDGSISTDKKVVLPVVQFARRKKNNMAPTGFIMNDQGTPLTYTVHELSALFAPTPTKIDASHT